MENLEQLINARKSAYELFHNNEVETANAIIDFLKTHCIPEGVESLIHLEYDSWYSRQRITFSGKVEFITDDQKRLEKGWKTDFGSDFNICITDTGIKVNKGTIGEYGLADKYQIARDKMIAMIWENHDAIIDIMTSTFQIDLYNKFYEADREVDRAEDDIKRAEEERKTQEALLKLRKAKFLVEHNSKTKYKDDDYWKSEKIGVTHHYYNYFIIDKITDKSVLGRYENYCWENKRLDINSILYQIKSGQLLAFEERPEDYVELNEETSSN